MIYRRIGPAQLIGEAPRGKLFAGMPPYHEIIAGEYAGFSDTLDYEAVLVRDGLVMLSWQEHIGSTVVHVLDLTSSQAYTAVTPAKGSFMRLTGRLEVKAGT